MAGTFQARDCQPLRASGRTLIIIVGAVAFLIGLVSSKNWFSAGCIIITRCSSSGSIGLWNCPHQCDTHHLSGTCAFPEGIRNKIVTVSGAFFQVAYLWVVRTHGGPRGRCVLFSFTKAGRALRAVASDTEMAGAVGVDVRRAIAQTFGLSFAVAAIAGVLIGPLSPVSFDMGDMIGLKAFQRRRVRRHQQHTGN